MHFYRGQIGYMKKSLIRIFALILLGILACGVLSGCFLFRIPEDDIDDGYDDPDDYEEPNHVFEVSCREDTTTITLSDVGYYGDTARLVYLKPYEYLEGEGQTGISTIKNVTPTFVGEYKCGTEATFDINRYNDDGYDTVYCKFYVVQGVNIVAGPIYPTEIQPKNDHDEVVKVNGIKGLMMDFPYEDEVSKLGCEHVQLNCLASDMIVPLETVDENTKEVTPIEYEEHLDGDGKGYIIGPKGGRQYVESYLHNGKKYYFRSKAWSLEGKTCSHTLDYYDRLISRYTRENVKVTLIVLVWINLNQYAEPYFLTYEAARTSTKATYYAVNTSNPYGAEYWAAFLEFISDRYSREDSKENAQYGSVESYIIGNEIDQFSSWNAMVDLNKHEALTIDDYCTEFERTLRISNQALKKSNSRNVPLVPLTHFWMASGSPNDYKPKEIFDFLSLKTKKEGNYNWGLAIHPYGADLTVVDFWNNDIGKGVSGSLNTEKITWTNLEVLQLYLEQPIKLCNGNVRDVYVTEGGVTSSDSRKNDAQYAKTKNQQAAGIAYAYYKSTQLSCIKALNYWRLCDHQVEGAYFGLMTEDGIYKPSYYVWKYIDTQYTWTVTDPYLEYIVWSDYENGVLKSYGYGLGTTEVGPLDFEWRYAMGIRKSNFDWNAHWDESKIVVRQADEEPPSF